MKPNWDQINSCLVLSMRHLGDAVILSGMINSLEQRNPKMIVDVLGRAQLEEVTRKFCSVQEYFGLDVPFYGHHRRDYSAIRHAIRQIIKIRGRKYDCCINVMGDIRENFLGWLTNAKNVVAPGWLKKHPFHRHIRSWNFLSFANYQVPIPNTISGYYDSIAYFARQLDLPALSWSPSVLEKQKKNRAPVIALHPGASHASKQWSPEKWRGLINELQKKDCRLLLFGSSDEEEILRREFHDEIEQHHLECKIGGIGDFLNSLLSADVLVGMDSFSVHAAHALGIPTVVLHGPFDPKVMTPPSSIPLSAGHYCEHFPCYNGQSCRNIHNQYVCVRAIDVADVLNAVEEALKTR
jgi:heptosyltransferase-3